MADKVTKKTTVKKSRVSKPKAEILDAETTFSETKSTKKFALSQLASYRPSKTAWIIIVVVGILLVFSVKKDLLLAATVNGAPITNIELLSRLNQQFRTQMVSQMVNEKLIMAEAQKNGVTVSSQEINDKISQLEGNVGGAQTLDSLLSQQGQSRSTLKDQIKIQLIVEKLYAKDATVSAEEVAKFVEQNKSQLQATDSAGQTKEAEDTLKQQKLNQAFNDKFQAIKATAKIQIF